jgi:hypothetical protein
VIGSVATRSGGGPTTVPAGYHLVAAGGPVTHELIETRSSLQPATVDLASGDQHPADVTSEVWADPAGGLARVVVRLDGQVQSDQVVRCGPLPHGDTCIPAFAFQRNAPTGLPDHYARDLGTFNFRGREVILLGKRGKAAFPPSGSDRIAVDARTGQLVGYRSIEDGGSIVADAWVQKRYDDVSPGHFSFVVPDGGIARELSRTAAAITPDNGLGSRRAQRALGRTPLWLGRFFAGQPLVTVSFGSEVLRGKSGALLGSAPFVRYDYGPFNLQEFGDRRPAWYLQGPQSGDVLLESDGSFNWGQRPDGLRSVGSVRRAVVSRDGLLVVVHSSGPFAYPLNGPRARRLIGALQPVPAG